ncbi:hypothetical protein [Paraburkholderia sp. MM5477-R1]|uniref:hypothetical protein n=1 Tax=Paraburkholderia sp. MM5477-R1 TaxID=2991062 RepID=UPI003D2252D9
MKRLAQPEHLIASLNDLAAETEHIVGACAPQLTDENEAMNGIVSEFATRSLFGTVPPFTQTSSSSGGGVNEDEGSRSTSEVAKAVFREIKAMVPTPMAEDFF